MDNNNENNNVNGRLIRHHSYTKSFEQQLKVYEKLIETEHSLIKESKTIESNRNTILIDYKEKKLKNRDFYENIRKLNKNFYSTSENYKKIRNKLDKVNDELFMNLFQQIDLYIQEVEKLNKKGSSNNDKEYKNIINNLKKQISGKNEKIRCCEKIIKEKTTKENKLLKEIESYKRSIIFYKDKIKIDLLSKNNNPIKIINLNNTNDRKNIKQNKEFNKSNISKFQSPPKNISFSPKLIPIRSSPSSDMCLIRTIKNSILYNDYSDKLNLSIDQLIIEDKNKSCSFINNTYYKKEANENFKENENAIIETNSDKNIFNRNCYDYKINKEKEGNKFNVSKNKSSLMNVYSLTQSNKNDCPKNTSNSKIQIKNEKNKKHQKFHGYINLSDEDYIKNKLYVSKNNNVNQLSEPEQILFAKKFLGNNNSIKNNIDYSSSSMCKNKNKKTLDTQQKINKNDIFMEYSRCNSKAKNRGNYFNKISKSIIKRKKNSNISIFESGNKVKTYDNGNIKHLAKSNIQSKIRKDWDKIILGRDQKSSKNIHSKKHNINNKISIDNNSTENKTIKNVFKINDISKNNNIRNVERLLTLSNFCKNILKSENNKKVNISKINVDKKKIEIIGKKKDKELSKILNEINDDFNNNLDMLSRQEEQIKFMLDFIGLNGKNENEH